MTPNEYATLIYYWNGDPHPERLQEIFSFLELRSVDPLPATGLAIAGVVLALELRYPDDRAQWRESFPGLYRGIDRIVSQGAGRQEWADFHLAQWFINHELKPIDEILDCVADGGDAGLYARRTLTTAADKCIPFRHALEQAQKARAGRMLINTTVQ